MTNTMIQIKDLQQNHQMTELSSAEEMMINGGCDDGGLYVGVNLGPVEVGWNF